MEEQKEVKYSSYTDAQKKATKKYRENNKDKVNEQRKKYYLSRKEKDPNFLPYKRQKAKEYYQKKKELKKALIEEQNKKAIEEQNKKVEQEANDEQKLKDAKDKEDAFKKALIEKLNNMIEPEVKHDDIVVEAPIIDETKTEKKKRKSKK